MDGIGETTAALDRPCRIGDTVSAVDVKVGPGCVARHFSGEMFGGAIAPVIMIHHIVMTGRPVGLSPRFGKTVVTALFEDTDGVLLTRAACGKTLRLEPGDLHCAATVESQHAPHARIHALQLLIDLPQCLRPEDFPALHAKACDMPLREAEGYRVRVLLGASGQAISRAHGPGDITMLDGQLFAGGRFAHDLAQGRRAWVYVLDGILSLGIGAEAAILDTGTATTIAAGDAAQLLLEAGEQTHFVAMATPDCVA